MRLVAVSIVKNEADVIEAFVRHTLAWVDHLLVFDHDSTDGTRRILESLRNEGLSLRLFTDDALGNHQESRSNHLTRLAARELGADWVLPLDADEFLSGPGRAALESELAASAAGTVRTLPLLNYFYSDRDDPAESNPVRRVQHRQSAPSSTYKVVIARALAVDEAVVAGKGSHALLRAGQPLPATPLPSAFVLAHFIIRSPEHQVLRVVLHQLQKFSHGRSHEDVDVHYRLGFQLLAEDPDLFFRLVRRPAAQMQRQPLAYAGAPLRYPPPVDGWRRVAQAMLPFLEKMARSHGRLVDQAGATAVAANEPVVRELPAAHDASASAVPAPGFGGFRVLAGLGPVEGPVPDAFLPAFHWGYAPATKLAVHSEAAGEGWLVADALTYSRDQRITISLNGAALHTFDLPHINQKERLAFALPLRAGANELTLAYARALVSANDPRPLAVIYLALCVTPPASPSA